MKTLLSFFILLLIFIPSVWTQTKSFSIPERMVEYGYLAGEKETSEEFAIRQLSVDTVFDQYYRLTTGRQIIAVWKTDSVYGGHVISYTRTYVSGEEKAEKESELLYRKEELQPDTSKMIFDSFQKLDRIPDMDSIKGWTSGFDGIVYQVESSTPLNYAVKRYWCPKSQDTTNSYVRAITDFVNFIYDDLNTYRKYQAFISALPQGSYTDGFIIMSSVRYIEKKKKKRKK